MRAEASTRQQRRHRARRARDGNGRTQPKGVHGMSATRGAPAVVVGATKMAPCAHEQKRRHARHPFEPPLEIAIFVAFLRPQLKSTFRKPTDETNAVAMHAHCLC